jgi:N-acetylmuramoyl-L-alanine amidase
MIGQKGLLAAVFVYILCSLLIYSISATPAFAQSELQRISAAERSDGLGFVVRYHLTEPVDSFKVVQPASDLIQMKLYTENPDTSGIRLTEPSKTIKKVHLYMLPNGYGVDVELGGDQFYKASAYPDRNEYDLLLALTESSPAEMAQLTSGVEPIYWSQFKMEMEKIESETEVVLRELFDDDYNQLHQNQNFDTVVIDAGHGGKDPGTIGYNGLKEKDVALAIALKLGSYIEEYLPDVNVVYTRKDDRFLELEERGSIANRARGDLFVSIHANAFRNPNARGSEVYILGLARTQSALEVMKRENSVVRLENGDGIDELTEEDLLVYELANAGNIRISERIAEKVEHQFRERARRHSRGVKQAQFVVLYHASMPALLVEAGFITNPNEAQFLASDHGQSIVASAIFSAIRDYKEEYERSRNLTRSQ